MLPNKYDPAVEKLFRDFENYCLFWLTEPPPPAERLESLINEFSESYRVCIHPILIELIQKNPHIEKGIGNPEDVAIYRKVCPPLHPNTPPVTLEMRLNPIQKQIMNYPEDSRIFGIFSKNNIGNYYNQVVDAMGSLLQWKYQQAKKSLSPQGGQGEGKAKTPARPRPALILGLLASVATLIMFVAWLMGIFGK